MYFLTVYLLTVYVLTVYVRTVYVLTVYVLIVYVLTMYGRSNHHKLESIFKGFARAMKFACSTDARLKDQLPSTKGLLEGASK